MLEGRCRLRITGAAPEDCLNALARKGVPVWEVQREDELHYSLTVSARQVRQAVALAKQSYCEAEMLRQRGIKSLLKQAIKRPVLLFGIVGVLILCFYLQSFVWVIEIDGCETVEDMEILQALQTMGVEIGSRSDQVDSVELRHRLLQVLPRLSWVAVNRTGCRLRVLTCGREERAQTQGNSAAHLVAVRDGVVTELNVSEGVELCKVGDTVKAGQILTSGFEDYGLCLKAVRAEGEIFGRTWYTGTVLRPAVEWEKVYTGQVFVQRSLIVGRKRINLSENSSFLQALCDKIVDTKQFALPGYTFPLILETATYREYRMEPVECWPVEAEESLLSAWHRGLQFGMIGGTIEETKHRCGTFGEWYVLRAESTCRELLSRTQPIDPIYEGETP